MNHPRQSPPRAPLKGAGDVLNAIVPANVWLSTCDLIMPPDFVLCLQNMPEEVRAFLKEKYGTAFTDPPPAKDNIGNAKGRKQAQSLHHVMKAVLAMMPKREEQTPGQPLSTRATHFLAGVIAAMRGEEMAQLSKTMMSALITVLSKNIPNPVITVFVNVPVRIADSLAEMNDPENPENHRVLFEHMLWLSGNDFLPTNAGVATMMPTTMVLYPTCRMGTCEGDSAKIVGTGGVYWGGGAILSLTYDAAGIGQQQLLERQIDLRYWHEVPVIEVVTSFVKGELVGISVAKWSESSEGTGLISNSEYQRLADSNRVVTCVVIGSVKVLAGALPLLSEMLQRKYTTSEWDMKNEFETGECYAGTDIHQLDQKIREVIPYKDILAEKVCTNSVVFTLVDEATAVAIRNSFATDLVEKGLDGLAIAVSDQTDAKIIEFLLQHGKQVSLSLLAIMARMVSYLIDQMPEEFEKPNLLGVHPSILNNDPEKKSASGLTRAGVKILLNGDREIIREFIFEQFEKTSLSEAIMAITAKVSFGSLYVELKARQVVFAFKPAIPGALLAMGMRGMVAAIVQHGIDFLKSRISSTEYYSEFMAAEAEGVGCVFLFSKAFERGSWRLMSNTLTSKETTGCGVNIAVIISDKMLKHQVIGAKASIGGLSGDEVKCLPNPINMKVDREGSKSIQIHLEEIIVNKTDAEIWRLNHGRSKKSADPKDGGLMSKIKEMQMQQVLARKERREGVAAKALEEVSRKAIQDEEKSIGKETAAASNLVKENEVGKGFKEWHEAHHSSEEDEERGDKGDVILKKMGNEMAEGVCHSSLLRGLRLHIDEQMVSAKVMALKGAIDSLKDCNSAKLRPEHYKAGQERLSTIAQRLLKEKALQRVATGVCGGNLSLMIALLQATNGGYYTVQQAEEVKKELQRAAICMIYDDNQRLEISEKKPIEEMSIFLEDLYPRFAGWARKQLGAGKIITQTQWLSAVENVDYEEYSELEIRAFLRLYAPDKSILCLDNRTGNFVIFENRVSGEPPLITFIQNNGGKGSLGSGILNKKVIVLLHSKGHYELCVEAEKAKLYEWVLIVDKKDISTQEMKQEAENDDRKRREMRSTPFRNRTKIKNGLVSRVEPVDLTVKALMFGSPEQGSNVDANETEEDMADMNFFDAGAGIIEIEMEEEKESSGMTMRKRGGGKKAK